MKHYIGVDLGSTNLKAAVYDEQLKLLAMREYPVTYVRENGFVEFDAERYFEGLLELLSEVISESEINRAEEIIFTGQAESMVVLDKSGKPLMNAISWMDERSVEECEMLADQFSPEFCASVTGQMGVLPTWPATKILWLRHNRREIFDSAAHYMLLKDFIIYRLTGKMLADCSIATFSFYFDIYKKVYWKEMLDAIGISEAQLPELCEPCTVAGMMDEVQTKKIGLKARPKINVGTLDHFTGMVGTGNTGTGTLTLSTGTVMALAAISSKPVNEGIAMHYGFIPDTHIMLPVVESGGVSLEWFRSSCMAGRDYDEINEVISQRSGDNGLIFLPNIVGTNAPDFDSDAVGVFYGLRREHDAFDMAHAVMEGVAFILKRNCDFIRERGTKIDRIIATGGGAKSAVWCQLQADITGVPICVPREKEAACLGAAIIGAVSDGVFSCYEEAAEKHIFMEKVYTPDPDNARAYKYEKFCRLYDCMLKVVRDD